MFLHTACLNNLEYLDPAQNLNKRNMKQINIYVNIFDMYVHSFVTRPKDIGNWDVKKCEFRKPLRGVSSQSKECIEFCEERRLV